jgi:carboxymethylenebutenolidase
MGFSVMIDGPKGTFGAHIAQPTQPNGAALVVIQEIFGVNAVMRELADYYAGQGYLAIVPDLFWRIKPGIAITDKTPDDMAMAFDYYGKFDVAGGIEDIQATIDYARTQCGKVGAVGYCLGGLLAYLTACETNIDASVSFYGVGIDQKADRAPGLKRPLMLHVASEDKFVSKQAQADISNLVASNPLMQLHVYQGLDHAFARPGGEHFDAIGAKLANDRTTAFFQENLS